MSPYRVGKEVVDVAELLEHVRMGAYLRGLAVGGFFALSVGAWCVAFVDAVQRAPEPPPGWYARADDDEQKIVLELFDALTRDETQDGGEGR